MDRLLADGHEPVVFDNLVHGKRSNIPACIPFILGDITDARLVASTVGQGFDAIVHMAAQKSVVGSMADPIRDAEINIIGTLNMLTSAAEFGVNRFAYAGTGGAIYGETELRPTSETHHKSPESPYGISKLTGERYIQHFTERFEMTTAILRMANVYGPRQDHNGEGGVVSIFSRRALQRQAIDVYGDGEQTRDYVYVGDVADAFSLALKADQSTTVNIGTGRETSLNDLIKSIESAAGMQFEINRRPARDGEIRNSCLDVENAKSLLAWKPSTSLDEGIVKTLNYFREI